MPASQRATRSSTHAAHAAPHNLPVQVTSFIGRQREIAEITRFLSTTRLLTLIGPGGCGKTRLAIQAGAALLGAYPDGVWMIALASLAEASLVAQTAASILGLPEHANRSPSATLVEHLRPRSALLIFDNCEHLLSSCAVLADTLLRHCPAIHILATSQEALGIGGEMIWRVPSLTFPDPGNLSAPESVGEYEAVRLFCERAALGRPGFAVTGDNARAIVHLCSELDGMPLAIELAAVRVKALTVEQIVTRLDDRFRLLTGGSRTALPRHQALEAAMDWSHDLLTEPAQIVLRRLSVFAGGCTLEAAEAVCGGGDVATADVLDLLAQLADKSMVIAEALAGGARYRLLETVRYYARNKLRESGETADVRRRHRDWYVALAERGDLALRGADQGAWLERLESEHDNLRAALQWSQGDPDDAAAELRLAGALYWFWFLHHHWGEGRGWLDGALARHGEVRDGPWLKAALGAAQLARQQADYARALGLCGEGIAACRTRGEDELLAWFLINLSIVRWYQGDADGAAVLIEDGLAISRVLELPWLTSMALAQAANLAALARGDRAQAGALYTESVALARSVGDRYRIAFALRGLGSVASLEGDYARAATLYAESLALSRDVGERWVAEECLVGFAGIACAEGRYRRGARLFGAAETLRDTLGLHRSAAEQTNHDRWVASARRGLSESEFAAEWAAGARLTFDQAIDDALTPAGPRRQPSSGARPGASAGTGGLTSRQQAVARLIVLGYSNAEIAAHLAITKRTADTHVQHILNKLGLTSRVQIAAWAVEHGLHTNV